MGGQCQEFCFCILRLTSGSISVNGLNLGVWGVGGKKGGSLMNRVRFF